MDPQSKQEVKYKTKTLMDKMSDKMDVASAKLRNDDAAKLDVAVLKATINDEVVPKEKHVVTLKVACADSAHRQDANYVIHALNQRLEAHKGKWLVTLKTLVVFHRLLREVDPTFQAELVKYSERTGPRRLLRLDTFADHTTKETWDYSAWIRVYSVYLDERMDLYRVMKFDPEQDEGESKLKACPTAELLERMPLAHKLLSRLIACLPEGSAASNVVTLQACGLVLKEVRSVYRLVSEAVMNLADKFFEMDRNDAAQGLELYKENVALNDRLNAFFTSVNNISALKGSVQFPTLQSLPGDFATTMEEYIKEAPRVLDPADPNASISPTGKAAAAGGKALADMRSSTIMRQGGATSGAIAGEAGATTITLPPGTLKIGGPISAPAPAAAAPPPPAPAAAPLVDLLGDDLGAVQLGASQQPAVAPPAAAAQPMAQPMGSADSFFGGSWMQQPPPAAQQQQAQPAAFPDAAASAAPAQFSAPGQPFPGSVGVAPPPGPVPTSTFTTQFAPAAAGQLPPGYGADNFFPSAAPQAAYGAAFPATFGAAGSSAAPPKYPSYAAAAMQQQGMAPNPYGAPGQPPPNPYGAPAQPPPNPYGAPGQPPHNPYGSPGQPSPNPYGSPAQPPSNTNPYAAPANTYAAPANTYAAHTYAAPANTYAAPANTYASAAPAQPFNAFTSPAPTTAAAVNPFSAPGMSSAAPAMQSAPAPWDPHHDPLSNLSLDILGKPSGYQAPQPTLKQLGQAQQQPQAQAPPNGGNSFF